MDQTRWRQIERLYHEAQARSPDERVAFLAEACAGDAALRREVESLLEAPATAEGFLATPPIPRATLTGRRLGVYQVEEQIGVGGMGEVYRARDTRLGRDVAVKVLPGVFVADRDRLARFEREARALAALNHPNIATIHGVEEADGVRALVMELVAGETLAERIARGPLKVPEALALAAQIADALDAAHEKGIIHRDLKPANIKITPAGTVKVLDFGLAKATDANHPDAPTMTVGGTGAGVIVGTAAYMSPEQARGLEVDKRTDIWAFGCVLYEMLTGRAAFASATVSDTIAKILEREPDWSLIPGTVPSALRRLIKRCLEKDLRRRLRDIGDVHAELTEPAAVADSATETARGHRQYPWRIVAVATLAAILLLGVVMRDRFTRSGEVASPVTRTTLTLPAGQELDTRAAAAPIAVSSDGNRVAYVALRDGRAQLYVRELDAFEPTALPGTDGAMYPFFSPDGMSVAFFADGKLKRVSISGGAPVPICDAPQIVPGGTWSPDGTILFDPGNVGLMRVSASGGQPKPLVSSDPAKDRRNLSWPRFLPDGRAVLVTVTNEAGEGPVIEALTLDTGEWHLLRAGAEAQYVSSGHLLYHAPDVREGEVQAVEFDALNLTVRGTPFPVLGSVFRARNGGAAYFAAALTGTLVFAPGGLAHTLVDVDRSGRRTPLLDDRRGFRFPKLSPDGGRVAVTIDPRPSQIWVYDLARGTGIPLATDGHSLGPEWTPDGKRLVYSSRADLQWRVADATSPQETLLMRVGPQYPSSWTRDGKALIFHEDPSNTNSLDIGILETGGADRPLIATPASELHGTVSPNGRWIAFSSDESGRREIHVRPFPDVNAGQWVVSRGGDSPLWSQDGTELFYMSGGSLMSVRADTYASSFVTGAPVALFTGPFDTTQDGNYDVFPDGQHFVMVEADPDARPTRLQVVLNWSDELKRREAATR